MRAKFLPSQRMKTRTRLLIIGASTAGIGLVVFLMFFSYFNTGIQQEAKASGTETIPSGSFIINMGITPQTYANGLLPYGMIYELITTYNVPVKWIIEPSKSKDGNDFTHNSVNYRGSAFIIPAIYVTSEVNARINHWKSRGVQGNFSVSSMNLPVYATITSFPMVIIDNLSANESIIQRYYTNAGIPSTAYVKGSPDQVNGCHDMWVNPHGDPTWTTHSYLYDFVTQEKSFIWMQCHAVSVMESCKQSISPYKQLNYLTTNGLQCYQSGKCQDNTETHEKAVPGSITYLHSNDPVMQYIGGISNLISGGSERWFIPRSTGGWRSTTKRLVTVGTTTSPHEGVGMVYGPAYGDTSNGYVMYMGGHDMHEGTSADRVAGQRSYFNFLLLAGKLKAPVMDKFVPGELYSNNTDTFSVSVSGGTAPYTYSWSTSSAGTFQSPNSASTTFTAPVTFVPLQTVITCVVTDACGRRTFFSQMLTIHASPLPITLISFTAKPYLENQVQLNWTTGTEKNNQYFTVERSKDGIEFQKVLNVNASGNSSTVRYYSAIDKSPLSGTSYYRLSQTDFDGTLTNLKVVKTEISKQRNVSKPTASPNPFSNHLNIQTDGSLIGSTHIRVYSITGKMVYEKQVAITEGETILSIEGLDQLPAGNYFIRYQNGEKVSEALQVVKR